LSLLCKCCLIGSHFLYLDLIDFFNKLYFVKSVLCYETVKEFVAVFDADVLQFMEPKLMYIADYLIYHFPKQ